MTRYEVTDGKGFRLADHDPHADSGVPGKVAGRAEVAALTARLDELQEKLYADGRHKVLVVLQGMDTSGKDGTIRHVMGGFDAVGVRVASFKKPTAIELDHDFLWRIHAQTPASGEVVVFNRSHYEDVLIVRVRELVPEKVWRKRYAQINDFERILAENGTLILKFFLHISKSEQKKRLQERIDDPTKRWKFQSGDLGERELWNQYVRAYEDALSKTSTDVAPWYIVPANAKWYRNYVVASVIAEALEKLKMKYPQPDLSGVLVS